MTLQLMIVWILIVGAGFTSLAPHFGRGSAGPAPVALRGEGNPRRMSPIRNRQGGFPFRRRDHFLSGRAGLIWIAICNPFLSGHITAPPNRSIRVSRPAFRWSHESPSDPRPCPSR